MGNICEDFEYELIGIEWELQYDLSDASPIRIVKDESDQKDSSQPTIVYDENGIPMGHSIEEIRIRQEIIQRFWSEWRENHTVQEIYNEKIQEPILLRSISLAEAKEHSAKSYKSTLAIMQMDEVLSKASPVGRTSVKQGNKNQAEFSEMLIMVYRRSDLGTIKVTVGVRHKFSKESPSVKVQYGMSSIAPDQPLLPSKKDVKKKKHLKK